MMKTYEEFAAIGYLAPIDANALNTNLTAIDMSLWSEIAVILQYGVVAASETLALTVQDSATSGGSYVQISGKLWNGINTDDGRIIWINVLAEEMNPGARFIKVFYNFSAHSALASILVLGRANNPPATDNKLAAETVVD
jgi:hypothetical protein